MTRRPLDWLKPGDPAATLAALEADLAADRIDATDRVRAVWVARWLRETYAGTAFAERADSIIETIDPSGCVPAQPSIVELRGWVELHHRKHGKGSLSALAFAAGLLPQDVSFLRAGRAISPERQECIAAALIALAWRPGESGTGT